MKSDKNGVSTCKPGEEGYEFFEIQLGHQSASRIQYDYCTPDGMLFSCIAKSLNEARAKRDTWLAEQDRISNRKHTNKPKME